MSITPSAQSIEQKKKSSLALIDRSLNATESVLKKRRQEYQNQKNKAEQKIACAKENTTIDSDVELEKVKLYEQEIREIDDCLALIPGYRNSLQSVTTVSAMIDLRRAFQESIKSTMNKISTGELFDDTTVKPMTEAEIKEVQRSIKEIVDRLVKNDNL